MLNTKVTVNLVTWNGIKYIADCLNSVEKQTFSDYDILVIDNGSTDNTVEYIKQNHPQITVIKNIKNLGFAKAHNQAIKYSNSPFVLILNQDVILAPTYLENLIKVIENNQVIAAVSGKLLKIKTSIDDIETKIKTKLIDTTALKIFKNRRVIDLGSGENDNGQFDKLEEVFGFSATALLFRREALEKARIILPHKNIDEFFDEDFFSYKEDIDLSWRLQILGWKFLYVPSALAFHYRSAVCPLNDNFREIINNRKNKAEFVNKLSYKNHLLTILKNEHKLNFIKYFPHIFFYEMKKIFYMIAFEPKIFFGAINDFFPQIPRALAKRKILFNKSKVRSDYISQWFS